jgi:ectoine hydroxylase-related dioxygenase (phytanoyl-CoA dioxygenase family)
MIRWSIRFDMSMKSALPLDQDGFAIVHDVLTPNVVDELLAILSAVAPDAAQTRRGEVFAVRNLFASVPEVRALATSPALRALVEPVLGPQAFAVRGLFFDKPPEANWKVPYHQDLAIAVKARHDVPGFGPWTTKAGVPHTHAPTDLLEGMLTLRLHLDDCEATNAPLRVLPGSHHLGKLDAARIQQLRDEIPEVVCVVPRGGALLMRPLLLHASSPAETPRHRRVLHIEYASTLLPDGLEWQETVHFPLSA